MGWDFSSSRWTVSLPSASRGPSIDELAAIVRFPASFAFGSSPKTIVTTLPHEFLISSGLRGRTWRAGSLADAEGAAEAAGAPDAPDALEAGPLGELGSADAVAAPAGVVVSLRFPQPKASSTAKRPAEPAFVMTAAYAYFATKIRV